MYKYKRFVFLVKEVLSERDYKRFGIYEFIEAGIDVSVFLYLPNNCNSDIVVRDDTTIIRSKKDLYSKLSELNTENDLVFYYTGMDVKMIHVNRMLKRMNIDYCVSSLGAIPTPDINSRVRRVLKDKVLRNPINLFKYILFFIYRKYFLYSAKYCITNNKNLNHVQVNNDTEIVLANSYDYDLYIKNDIKVEELNCDIVFLDEGATFHPDDELLDLCSYYGDRETYYSNLRGFFNKLETKIGKQIVIAGHPRIDYSDKKELFGNREIVSNRTIDLVMGANLVLTHASTSVNFAVMFRKKVLYLKSEEFTEYFKSFIGAFENALGAPSVDMKSGVEDLKVDINPDMYDEYTEKYIFNDVIKDKKNSELLLEQLKLN